MTKPLNELSAIELKLRLANREVSSREVVTAVLDHIDRVDGDIQAFLTVRDKTELLAEADVIDRRRARGGVIGQLSGLPVAVKDNICTKNLRTTCASRMLELYKPQYDATVIEKIRRADGIVLGKTNMDEFAMGSSTENSAFQVTRNPHNLDYVPGGTSGGSAAAVAANETILAIGSDTGGSIRQPASYCGVVGLKPSYGGVSRYGLIAYASSLDQIGTLTKTVADAELLFSVIRGYDPRDATSQQSGTSNSKFQSVRRIGVPREYFVEGVDAEVKSGCDTAISLLTGLGYEIVPISLPHTKYAIPVYYIVASAEMSSNLARYDSVRYGHRANDHLGWADMIRRSRTEGLGAEVRRRIILGTFVLSSGYYDAYYNRATAVRELIRRDFQDAFTRCDVILTPVAPTPAFRIGEKTSDPLKMYLVDIFSVTANLAELPAISIPCGVTPQRLPLSVQLLGPMHSEDTLIAVAGAFEKAMNQLPNRNSQGGSVFRDYEGELGIPHLL